jgi:hypothetical protein
MNTDQASTSGDAKTTSGVENVIESNATSGADDASNYKSVEFVEKLKKEKENYKKQLEALKSQLNTDQENKLKEKEEYKKLAELKTKELETFKAEKQALEDKIKLGTINSAVKTELEKLGLDTSLFEDAYKLAEKQIKDGVTIDPDTNSVIGADEVAKQFYQKYSTLGFFKKATAGVNHTATKGNAAINGKPDFSKMKTSEIVEYWKKLQAK